MELKVYLVIIVYALLVKRWYFAIITTHFNQIALLYQKAWKYNHHDINYQEGFQRDITPFDLWLKKNEAFNALSQNFNTCCDSVLEDTEQKFRKSSLKEAQNILVNASTAVIEVIERKRASR